jgi:ABC-type Mn2+/Zn2+ transport system permease subunit
MGIKRCLAPIDGVAPLVGAASAFVGYWVSFTFDLPTGACTVGVSGAFFLGAFAVSKSVRHL